MSEQPPTEAWPTIRLHVKLEDGEETRAELDVDVDVSHAWLIFQYAVNEAVKPPGFITFPSKMTAAEVEEVRRRFQEKHV